MNKGFGKPKKQSCSAKRAGVWITEKPLSGGKPMRLKFNSTFSLFEKQGGILGGADLPRK